VLARAQRRDDVLGVEGCRRDDEDRLQVAVSQQRFVIAMEAGNAERIARPGDLLGNGAAGGE
jgi:hypothetical protein